MHLSLPITLSAFPFLGGEQPPPDTITDLHTLQAHLDKFVPQVMSCFEGIGVQVSIVTNERNKFIKENVINKAYGYRDVETKLPMRTDTMHGIGSCSKAFTATLAAVAVDKGYMRWNEPVKSYYNDWKVATEEGTKLATLEDLLGHKMGSHRLDIGLLLHPFNDTSADGMLPRLKHIPQKYGLREQFLYNNWMVSAAGWIVAMVLKSTWEDAITTHVFQPIGMAHTVSRPSDAILRTDEEGRQNYAITYAPSANGELIRVPSFINVEGLKGALPAGGIHSNAEDMSKWLKFQLSNGRNYANSEGEPLISEAALNHTKRPHMCMGFDSTYTEGYGDNLAFGLGWINAWYLGYRVIQHSGTDFGHYTQVRLVPEAGLGIFVGVIGNGTNININLPMAITDSITDLLIGAKNPRTAHDYCHLTHSPVSFTPTEKPPPPKGLKPAPPGTKFHDPENLVGSYLNDFLGYVNVTNDGEDLKVVIGNDRATGKLVPSEGGTDSESIAMVDLPYGTLVPTITLSFKRSEGKGVGPFDSFTMGSEGEAVVWRRIIE